MIGGFADEPGYFIESKRKETKCGTPGLSFYILIITPGNFRTTGLFAYYQQQVERIGSVIHNNIVFVPDVAHQA